MPCKQETYKLVVDKEYMKIENYQEQVMTKVTCGQCYRSVKVLFIGKNLNCGVDVKCGECGSKKISHVTEISKTNMVVYSALQSGTEYYVMACTSSWEILV